MPGTYLNHYSDHQATIAAITTVETAVNNIPIADYDPDFVAVNTKLDTISSQVTTIGNNLVAPGSVINLNATEFIAPLILNQPWLDLTHLLGSADSGFVNPGGVAVNVVGNSTEGGTANSLLSKSFGVSAWYSTNSSGRTLTIDFGFNKTSRTIKLTGLGFQSYDVGGGTYPVSLIIAGSNNGSTFTTINTWSAIGFNADAQWKYTTFSNTTAYRYIRITQSGLNTIGNNYFSCRELRFYGSIQNP